MKTRSSKNASADAPVATPKVAPKKSLKRARSPAKAEDASAKVAKKMKWATTAKGTELEVVVAPAPAPTPASAPSDAPKYEGNFDFFFDGACACGTDFQKRYDDLRQKQIAGNRPNGLCYFGPAPARADSSFETAAFLHPMEETPLGLALHSITVTATGGVSAQVGLLENNCGISTLKGNFSMKRVWAKPGDASVELFEGELSVKIGYGAMYSSRGFGRGTSNDLSFTAIRKRNAAGEETGLGPRKCEAGPLSHGSGSHSYGGGLFDDLGFSDDDVDSDGFGFSEEESDAEDSDGNAKGSLRWHYRRSKMGIYNEGSCY
ncbi:hypothetical protein DFH06DRAFT_1312731 [Mycena polygramma]|nr:hypothetical protein DFH06DRAFT_1312731 [Mycena polygramma]